MSRPKNKTQSEAPGNQGAFLPNGSWSDKAVPGPFHHFVLELVHLRRAQPTLPPWEFARRIALSPFRAGFPCTGEWDQMLDLMGQKTPLPWFAASTSTSAESTLKHAGSISTKTIDAQHSAELKALNLPEHSGNLADLIPDKGYESDLNRRIRERREAMESERQKQLAQIKSEPAPEIPSV